MTVLALRFQRLHVSRVGVTEGREVEGMRVEWPSLALCSH